MEATGSKYIVNETLGCVSVEWGTDNAVDHSLRQVTGSLEQQGRGVGKWFEMECMQTVQGCVHVLSANHAIVPFTERIL